MLDEDTPRPGESYCILVGIPGEDVVAIKATFSWCAGLRTRTGQGRFADLAILPGP